MAASARRAAGVNGDLDHVGALSFLQGLLTVLRHSGHPGLLLVLDEVETLQRVRVQRLGPLAQRLATHFDPARGGAGSAGAQPELPEPLGEPEGAHRPAGLSGGEQPGTGFLGHRGRGGHVGWKPVPRTR